MSNLKQQADDKFRKLEFDEAIKLYEEALQTDVSLSVCLLNVAVCALKLKQWQRVIDACKQFESTQSADAGLMCKCHYRAACAYFELDQCLEACMSLQLAWKTNCTDKKLKDPVADKMNRLRKKWSSRIEEHQEEKLAGPFLSICTPTLPNPVWYPVGNTQVIDVCSKLPTSSNSTEPLRLLFTGVGDPRQVFHALLEDEMTTTTQPVEMWLNDLEPEILARNTLIIALAFTPQPADSQDIEAVRRVAAYCVWWCFGFPIDITKFLIDAVDEVLNWTTHYVCDEVKQVLIGWKNSWEERLQASECSDDKGPLSDELGKFVEGLKDELPEHWKARLLDRKLDSRNITLSHKTGKMPDPFEIRTGAMTYPTPILQYKPAEHCSQLLFMFKLLSMHWFRESNNNNKVVSFKFIASNVLTLKYCPIMKNNDGTLVQFDRILTSNLIDYIGGTTLTLSMGEMLKPDCPHSCMHMDPMLSEAKDVTQYWQFLEGCDYAIYEQILPYKVSNMLHHSKTRKKNNYFDITRHNVNTLDKIDMKQRVQTLHRWLTNIVRSLYYPPPFPITNDKGEPDEVREPAYNTPKWNWVYIWKFLTEIQKLGIPIEVHGRWLADEMMSDDIPSKCTYQIEILNALTPIVQFSSELQTTLKRKHDSNPTALNNIGTFTFKFKSIHGRTHSLHQSVLLILWDGHKATNTKPLKCAQKLDDIMVWSQDILQILLEDWVELERKAVTVIDNYLIRQELEVEQWTVDVSLPLIETLCSLNGVLYVWDAVAGIPIGSPINLCELELKFK